MMLKKVFLFYRTVNIWSASNDEAVASLLQTLKELKSDLLSTSASQVRKPAYICQLSAKLFVYFGLQYTCKLILLLLFV